MNTEQLERRMDIEAARLGVAEDLGGVIAVLAACAAYLALGSWWITVAAGVGSYIVATHPYKKREANACDAYERATGTGKYYRPS